MVKRKQKLILCLLFFSLFSLASNAIIWFDYDYNTHVVTHKATNAEKRQNYRLDFDKDIPRSINYVEVELTAADGMPTPILQFSSIDDNCYDGRQQMVKDPNSNKVNIWLKIEEFQEGDLFVIVECITDAKCDYTLKFSGKSQIEMGSSFTYAYLVGKQNKDMTFSADILDSENVDAVTFYAVGSKSVSINVDGTEKATKFSLGSAITIKPKKEEINSSQYSISVSAAEGDYVYVGINNVKESKTAEDLLVPNGAEVSGLLKRGVLEDQCFEMASLGDLYKNKDIYINGRIYNKVAEVYLRDSNFKVNEDSVQLVTDGFYNEYLSTNGKKMSICIKFPEESYAALKTIPFTFSVIEPTSINDKYKWYPPQVMGQIYRRIIPKGTYQFFSSLAPPKSKRITYNLKAKSGFPIMYSGKCSTYPFCNNLDITTLDTLKKANRMFTYTYPELTDENAISINKNVMLVKCEDDDNSKSGYCIVEPSFIVNQDELEIIENESFGSYAIKGDKGSYKINLSSDENVRIVNVDIMIMSGDIDFSVKGNGKTELNYQKYYLSNKIYFNIPMEGNDDLTELTFEYSATLSSYYTFRWNANRRGDGGTQFRDYLTSGTSYLVDIDPTAYWKVKRVRLQNLRHKDGKPFLANFFALNCEFEIYRGDEGIGFYDGYAQEILTTSSANYTKDYYDYYIEIWEPDLSNYNHKMCMLYVAGVETSDEKMETEIVIAENINQQVIFEKGFNLVRFLYPNPDKNKDLVLYINVIDISRYKITVFGEKVNLMSLEVSRTRMVYLRNYIFDRACQENNVCHVIIQVELLEDLVGTNPMIEITLRPILNTPTYLQKSQAKKDFVCGQRFYYLYTDVGKNEEGEILVDFARGNGNIYAKVVRKDQTSADEEANWRDKYRMPSKDWEDSLEYDSYFKKLKLNPEDTADCIEGCYLLISIQLSLENDYAEEYRFFPFTILTRITPANRAYTDIPKVVIQVDEYIIGNVDKSETERIYEFYETWLPHDSETVEFDWQSGVAGLYINLGGTRPTTKNADFKLLPSGSDSILSLTKTEILERANAKKIPIPYSGKIQDLSLVIGVWTDKTDSVSSEPYSLRVHQPIGGELNIVEVNANQKVLCKPTVLDNKYRCLFMVVYERTQVKKDLIIYATSTDKSATTNVYGKYLVREIYDESQKSELKTNTPTVENDEFELRSKGIEYIHALISDNMKYVYISVVADKPSDMMILTSLITYETVIDPNPSTESIYAVDFENDIELHFDLKSNMMINIVSVGGEAELYWSYDENKYELKGAGDRLSLMRPADQVDNDLIIINNTPKKSRDYLGFVFYVYYTLRPEFINFDEITPGKSATYIYKNTKFPVYLFNKVLNSENDVTVAVHFTDKNVESEQRASNEPPFSFYGVLAKQNIVYMSKIDKDITPPYEKAVHGSYDPALDTAQVSLSKEDLKNFNIKATDVPTLYFGLEQTENNLIEYENFDLEVQVSKANEGIPAVEGVYNYGKVMPVTAKNVHKLSIDKARRVMRIQISVNSDSLDYVISDDENSSSSMKFDKKRGNGKDIITLDTPDKKDFIYLTVKIKDTGLAQDRRLNNYCFKYVNAESNDKFKEYKIKGDRKVQFEEKTGSSSNLTDITAKFNRIEGDFNVTYCLKVVPNKTHAYKESYDTIAVSDSPSSYALIKNPSNKDDTITLTVADADAQYVYLEVTATIVDGKNIEYETYEGKHVERPYTGPGSGGVSTGLFIAVGSILLLMVIGLVIAIIIFKNKNKSLLNQVKHVSFQAKATTPQQDLLLNKNQGNIQDTSSGEA